MSKLTTAKLAVVALLVSVLGILPAATAASQPQPSAAPTATLQTASTGKLWKRTELYFGRNSPNGEITEEQFAHFLEVEVTKRFPDGLTVLDGLGQFLGSSGKVEREKSKLLILLYPLNDRLADKKIEDIRGAYKGQFQQESVLRVDTFERVSF